MVRLHPYESIFYNVLAGPSDAVYKRYETDYWFSSYREAATWINARQAASETPLHVLFAGMPPYTTIFTHYLNAKTQADLLLVNNFAEKTLPPDYDYYLGSVAYGQCNNFGSAPVAHKIAPDGILIAVIRTRPAVKP
jgi:hypothetical protein